MTTAPSRTAPLDLLVVGGLTIDRFAGRPAEPGGSVLHIARALAPRGVRLGVITAAGQEPAAQRGVAELAQHCAVLEVADVDRTMTFRHDESHAGRMLRLEEATRPLPPPAAGSPRPRARAILLAPLAEEVGVEWLAGWAGEPTRGAIMQGWLRTVDDAGRIGARRVGALGGDLRAAFSELDLLVASRQDLAADGAGPADQLRAVRRAVGRAPILVVTAGADGASISAPSHAAARDSGWRMTVPRRVDGVPDVGAGDVLAAAMLVGGWPRDPGRPFLERRIRAAMATVVDVLDARHPR